MTQLEGGDGHDFTHMIQPLLVVAVTVAGVVAVW